jgi:hypothetical protein
MSNQHKVFSGLIGADQASRPPTADRWLLCAVAGGAC